MQGCNSPDLCLEAPSQPRRAVVVGSFLHLLQQVLSDKEYAQPSTLQLCLEKRTSSISAVHVECTVLRLHACVRTRLTLNDVCESEKNSTLR